MSEASDDIGEAATLLDEATSKHGPKATRRTASDAVEPARAFAERFQQAEPQKLGRYAVLGTLGQGGMGVVLRAYDRELDRPVALKVLHRELDEQHTTRLRREAQAMAKLSHPNVVQVYEVGEIDGQTFVAMELVKGKTAREWMHAEPRPDWRACVRLFVQLGAGLAAAHERGLVHRDFKPGNAIIDDKGRARVLDFGLARQGEDDGGIEDEPSIAVQRVRTADHEPVALDVSLTTTGAVLGTPAYMPPEQMRGAQADARSDQFSFCVSLCEAVYGERPFEGSTMAALMVSMTSGAVRPPPKGSTVPAALRKMLLRGLAIDPAERWPSMEALLERLRALVDPRRGRWIALAIGVGLLAIGGGLGADRFAAWASRCSGAQAQLSGVWDEGRRQEVQAAILGTKLSYAPETWERVEQRLDEYTRAWTDEHTEVCEATAVRGEQSEEVQALRMGCLHERRSHVRATVDVLAHADAEVVENAVQAVASLPRLSRCADVEALRAEVPPPEDPEVAQRVAALEERLVVAEAYQNAGRYAEGLAEAESVAVEAEELGWEPLLARTWLRWGLLQERAGDSKGAVTTLGRAYDAAVAQRMPTEAASASMLLVCVLSKRLARHEEARRWTLHSDPLARAAGTDEARAADLNSKGLLAEEQAEYDQARDFYARALAIRERALGPDHPDVATSLGNLGSVADLQGKYEEARDFYERALAIESKVLGPEHPDVAGSLTSLGCVADTQGKYEEARDFHQRALAIAEKALGPDHPDVAAPLNNLANVANAQGKYEEARDLQQRAHALYERALGPDHPKVAGSLHNLGMLADSQGKYEEARDFYERALAIREKALGSDHPVVADSLHSLGHVARMQGKYEEARDFYERTLAIREKALGPDHPNVAGPLTSLGGVLLDLDQPALALVPFERAHVILTTQEDDPALLANTRFILAHALWSAPASAGRDRTRAHRLAEQARDAWTEAEAGWEADLAEVDRWLAEHRVQEATQPPAARR